MIPIVLAVDQAQVQVVNAPIWVQFANRQTEKISNPPLFRIASGSFTFRFKARVEGGQIHVLEILKGTSPITPVNWCVTRVVPDL